MKVFSPFGSVAEHSLGKGEVPGPIPGMGTIFKAGVRVAYRGSSYLVL
jgi:hypothetical protein